MNHERVKNSLRLIQKVYRPILDVSHAYVIPAAVEQVEASWQAYVAAKKRSPLIPVSNTWGYAITHEQPLRFTRSSLRELDLQVDVYCNVQWMEADLPVTQEIKMRIWSHHQDTMYDPSRDADDIFARLADPERPFDGRVISRFHFDRANHDQGVLHLESNPEYHLQFGGKPEDYEVCWHPKKVNVPRLPFPPMELVLTCQIVAASFFRQSYLEIAEKGEWQQEINQYQKFMLREYYKKCLDLIEGGRSLLDGLDIRSR